MASLNTLRTKFGVVLTFVIAFALLAFILSLKTEMGFSGNDPKVAVLDGTKVNYSEYLDQYDAAKQQYGADASSEEQNDMISNVAWQALIAKHVLTPGFEKMGLGVTDAERLSILGGEHISQVLYNAFANPRTGEYDAAAVYELLSQSANDPRMAAMWSQLMAQVKLERSMQKFMGLARGGAYVNALEVAAGVDAANDTYSGKWTGVKYSSVADSLVKVGKSDLKKYYDTHKAQYKQLPNRSISYVVFDVDATSDDMLAIENEVRTVGAEFAAADDVKAFVRQNRHGSVADRYVTAAQLADDEAEALAAGRQYGPVLKNNVWTIARVVDSKMAPDSLGIRHIVLPYNQETLADSLLTALRRGGDFAAAAAEYSVYEATAQNGGEVGVMPFAAFNGEFAEALADAKSGDIVKVASGEAIQLIQVYRADKPSKHVQVATISYPVEPSSATKRDVHAAASAFSVNAEGSVEKFNEAASASAVTPRIATVNQGERTIRGLDNSREIVRWVYGAEKGEMSEIFNLGDAYVVAVVTDIDNDEYKSLAKVNAQVHAAVLREKKFDYLASKVAGSTLAEVASSLGADVEEFSNVRYPSYYVEGLGFEPRVVGAITSAETGAVSAPVRGMSGLYVFEVADVAKSDAEQTPEAEKVRAQATAENYAVQAAIGAVQQMAEIQDLRGKYF